MRLRLNPLCNRTPAFCAHISHLREPLGRPNTQPRWSCIPNRVHARSLHDFTHYITASVLSPCEPLRLALTLHFYARRTDSILATARVVSSHTASSRPITLRAAEEGSRVSPWPALHRSRSVASKVSRGQSRSILHTHPQERKREAMDIGSLCLVLLHGRFLWWSVDKSWSVKSRR